MNTLRRLMAVVSAGLTLAVLTALLFPIAAQAAPRIEATPTGLLASGITPGGDAVWFGLTVESYAMARHFNRYADVVRDADGDGVVLYEAPRLTRFSLLFVADAATGEWAVFRGEGVDPVEHDLRGNQWRSSLEHFDIPGDFLDILLVRPGDGAATATVFEGLEGDGDNQKNGKFRLKLKDMRPVGDPVKKLNGNIRRGDLLVVINPRTFAYAVRAAKD